MRRIREIALDIQKDWGAKVNYGAKPYLSAMKSIDNVNDKFYYDSGRSVVNYFLANAGTYRGENAKKYKEELKEHINFKNK